MAKGFNPKESGYVEVKDRIVKFYEKYPDGAIRSDIVEHTDTRVVVKSYCYAHKDDQLSIGEGHSQLEIPGKTSFTKGSELENAETSAIGRALASAGFEVTIAFASANEVRNHAGEDEPEKMPSLADRRNLIKFVEGTLGLSNDDAKAYIMEHARIESASDLTFDMIEDVMDLAADEAKETDSVHDPDDLEVDTTTGKVR